MKALAYLCFIASFHNGHEYYCWSKEQFEELCKEISGSKDIIVTTTYEFVAGGRNGR